MSTKDDVKQDLAVAYPDLTRSDLERVVTLLAQTPAIGGATSIATALRPLLPDVAKRLDTMSAGEVSEYLRILKGAVTTTLQSWHDGTQQGPGIEQIHTCIDAVMD
ncbi:hypothetical protein [Mycobacterium sp. SMC-4]|uniref:hypothetical protein n=1 Tax=Mycobacterium sp. SMC-4 TaxID=2857059 RepID=UPI0021B4B10E|nr:hypothetical protein [Mycobacterium sp. SMC-4]UXA18174.1 hypothetical protein KXD98_00065 [Mycobacterium sp. SMC-4]